MNRTRSLLVGMAIVALTASSGFAQSSGSGTDGPYLRLEGGWSHPVDMERARVADSQARLHRNGNKVRKVLAGPRVTVAGVLTVSALMARVLGLARAVHLPQFVIGKGELLFIAPVSSITPAEILD